MDHNLLVPCILIVLGLLLMLMELVLFTHGISFVLGVAAMVVGVTMIFAGGATQGFIALAIVVVLVPFFGSILVHYWPKTPLGRRFVLPAAADDATVAQMPVNLELEQLRGRFGKTLSALRPAGVTDFDGRRVDTLSEGPMVEPGAWVRCIDVRAGRVIVRRVERPPELADFDPGDLRG